MIEYTTNNNSNNNKSSQPRSHSRPPRRHETSPLSPPMKLRRVVVAALNVGRIDE
jgi:hypothetical protein